MTWQDASLPLMLLRSQTAIATQIYNAKADYVLALKANHPTLHGQIKT
ncbi:hypothetical protein OGM63_19800 [Plectonema radiosum NIES-515]|uniref:Uncharacterized protein n=1 Tax=Plectonema radiosum NIES-515 TaxID=2986073 RepID=A0ABT3B2W8_9CYAN|nr:hypothetical protein [Plectonema radiosum]MCV3215727.1 hypothetical protein [Plectonema radiosum NIES-515]